MPSSWANVRPCRASRASTTERRGRADAGMASVPHQHPDAVAGTERAVVGLEQLPDGARPAHDLAGRRVESVVGDEPLAVGRTVAGMGVEPVAVRAAEPD